MINLYYFVLSPILIAILMYIFNNKYMKTLAIVLQSCFLVATTINFSYVKKHGTIIENLGGWPDFVGISLKMDLLSAVMIMLSAFLFLAFLIFDYPKKYVNRLFVLLFLILQSLITGIFLSNDLFNIFVLFEVSTIVVSILIMFKKDSKSVYDGIVYFLVNTVAMTFFLFGTGFLYKTFGVFDFNGISEGIKLIENNSTLFIPYALMITAAGIKTSLMPLFSWLPKAHVTSIAPPIVSALLSGLYVKTGIYLFVRLQEMFHPAIDTSAFFMLMGFLTGVVGFLLALSQTDIKLMLAYSTISQIGLIMIGLNYPGQDAYWGSMYHIINHAFFKSTLFLIAGIIVDEYGTRNITKIKGVFKRMPFISIASFLAILGITGAPFFNGSFSKYLIKTAVSGSPVEYALIIINLGTVIYFLKFLSIFKGNSDKPPAKIDIYTRFITTIMALMCFIGGIYGQFFVNFLFNLETQISSSYYLQNIILFFLTVTAGYLFHRYLIPKLKFITKIKEFELDFNNICLSITLFFFATLIYLVIKG
ncbi:proton-conducting transporter membrane subunit [Herbivorax sp. ANBcel31]|uniref:complex I subunit 5 family protein n=1 Tax=Herbivorax sp. ANBcel31 TaxID=3069754 RepID=UPI0027B6A3EB|nr:proton-conducting transporter membrane subunit [Herbivorax sp. ANBcel31]MDQ2086163.1 proton-conducting transporter membrane subunit [Herbivorax sp. ANBcel31]